MGVRKRYPFTDVHVKELASLTDKEINVATAIKEPKERMKRLAFLFDLRSVITNIQDGEGVETEAEEEATPVTTSPAKAAAPKPPRKPRKTKAEKDAEKPPAATGEPATGEIPASPPQT